MPVFVALPDEPNSPALRQKIETMIPPGHALQLPIGAWLVSFDGTSRALSDVLGLSEGETTSGAVFAIGSYWGRQSKDVWEWLERMSA